MSPQRAFSLLLFSFFVAACSPEKDPVTNDTHQASQADEIIGLASMEADGTLVLRLNVYLDDSKTGTHGYFRYPPNHSEYEETLRHVGSIKPGEEKPLRPWL